MVKIRLFGGSSCPICELALLKIEYEKDVFELEYIDAFADETQNLCDKNNVNELPHMQLLDESKNILKEFIGEEVLSALKNICGR